MTIHVGDRLNMLTVISMGRVSKRSVLEVRCDCGTEKIVQRHHFNTGKVKSCGCLRKRLLIERVRIHGDAVGGQWTPEYLAWINMRARCSNPEVPNYDQYGGRGISVCPRWVEGENGQHPFECFLADLGRRPDDGYSIDRIDNEGDYEPGNVRWSTRKEQNRNRRRARMVTLAGETMTLAEAVERAGVVTYKRALSRLYEGWSVERAVSTPAGPKMRRAGS